MVFEVNNSVRSFVGTKLMTVKTAEVSNKIFSKYLDRQT